MIIHIVQSGETIYSISEYYKISADRLIMENGITNPDNLAIGQTIVIVQPETTYKIRPGDSLESIAKQHNVSPMELLRNNPFLSDQEQLYAGETIVIQYQTSRTQSIITSGYTFSYINRSVLIKTLPFLSYLTIFNYKAAAGGEIIAAADDTELIQLAVSYGVSPIMFVSTLTEDGMVNREANYYILNNPPIQDMLIQNSLQVIKEKGYHGINIYIDDINYDNIDNLSQYLKRAYEVFHSEGYTILITITPVTNVNNTGMSFDQLDYSRLSEYVDGIIFASYEWARTFGYPSSIFPVNLLIDLLKYVVTIIPPEKIFLGITTAGYDWTLPYIPGASGATVVTNNDAVQIAAENNIAIQYNEPAQSPYFYYMDSDGVLHVIWFKDARSFDARTMLVPEFNLQGLSFWTIMKFDAQMWFVINTQYYIHKF